ncbi:MAG TPA: hypothetical protein GXX14_08505 [Clostridiaceae bacterium]|nr:hypothetical protein [Clostridiaceae bacterium]
MGHHAREQRTEAREQKIKRPEAGSQKHQMSGARSQEPGVDIMSGQYLSSVSGFCQGDGKSAIRYLTD